MNHGEKGFLNHAISDRALDLGEFALDREYEQLNIRFPELPEVSTASLPRTRTVSARRDYPASNLRPRHQA